MKTAPRKTVTHGEPMDAQSARRVGDLFLRIAEKSAACAESVAVSGAGLSRQPETATGTEMVAQVAGVMGTTPAFNIREFPEILQVL